jgi:IstB-like ATP binding protein
MKLLSKIAKDCLPKKQEPQLVHAIQNTFVVIDLPTPILSSEATCPICKGNKGYSCLIDPKVSNKRMWFCSEPDCTALVQRSSFKGSQTMAKVKRSIEWPLFCEMNNIGDLHHDVSFEKIEQSETKIDYLRRFSKTPQGIILMEGEAGTGKTYASMALCELFTRTNCSCLFFTADRLAKQWLDTFKGEGQIGFTDRLKQVSLLVVDDFGTGEPSPGFMQFFMELINTRMQWSNRGTVISTNLAEEKLSKFCGEALSDRFKTGQKFQFKDKSKRKKTVI